jgi:hypothetical protein
MSKQDLADILAQVSIGKISSSEALELIWGTRFDGETEYKEYWN